MHAFQFKIREKMFVNKPQRIPKWQLKKETPEKLATQGTQCEEKENRNTTQYVLDITKRKQTQIM